MDIIRHALIHQYLRLCRKILVRVPEHQTQVHLRKCFKLICRVSGRNLLPACCQTGCPERFHPAGIFCLKGRKQRVLHCRVPARPAGELVKLAKEYTSTVSVIKEGKKADAKKVFGLMGLGVKNGMEITVQIEGEDEDTAAAAVEAFLKENL